MKILFILGNGFDLNAGLHTSYHDFYKYYESQPSGQECVVRMKKSIAFDKDATWADLEEGLGLFSKQCTKDEFLECIDDIKSELRKYLHSETDGKKVSGTWSQDILHPERNLESQLRQQYYTCLHNSVIKEDCVDIVSLNYTPTLEKLLNIEINDNNNDYDLPVGEGLVLKKVVHIHGLLDNEMNMGVNDSSQIENTSIVDEDVVEEFVKPEYNDAAMNTNNSLTERLINEANSIVIFGSSLGNTDRKWWKLIGQRVEQGDCALIYFVYDSNMDVERHPNYKKRWIKEKIAFLKKQMELPQDVDTYLKRICVGINIPIFNSVKILKNIVTK